MYFHAVTLLDVGHFLSCVTLFDVGHFFYFETLDLTLNFYDLLIKQIL